MAHMSFNLKTALQEKRQEAALLNDAIAFAADLATFPPTSVSPSEEEEDVLADYRFEADFPVVSGELFPLDVADVEISDFVGPAAAAA